MEPIPLRAHNLLCLLGFRGRGYDDRFVAAMREVHARLAADPTTRVEVRTAPDALCAACPHLRGGCTLGGPDHEAHMRAQDRAVAQRLGLSRAEAEDLMRLSVRLAVEARDTFWANPANRTGRPRPFVAASIGPYGAFLRDGSEYHGDYGLSEAELITFHRPRMAVLAAAGADMLACETIPCWVEARALVRLLEEFPGVSAWFSFSCRDATRISQGESLAECVALLDAHPQVAAVGVNCTAPRFVPDLAFARKGESRV